MIHYFIIYYAVLFKPPINHIEEKYGTSRHSQNIIVRHKVETRGDIYRCLSRASKLSEKIEVESAGCQAMENGEVIQYIPLFHKELLDLSKPVVEINK